MRLLFLGDLAQTGFGTATMGLGKALLDQGIDVRFCSLNEPPFRGWWQELPEWLQDRTASFDNPDGWLLRDDPKAKDKLAAMFTGGLFADGWAPESALILGDPGSLEISPVLDIIPDGMPVFHHVPIEGVGSPPAWRMLWNRALPVPTSRFGADELGRLLRRKIPFAYHGVDTDLFHPPSKDHPIVLRGQKSLHVIRGKRDAKEFFGLDPKGTLILRADRHMPRKRYWTLMWALAPVLERHPDAAFVWHCASVDQGGNLFAFRSHFTRSVAARMQPSGFHDQQKSLHAEAMAVLYAAADLYVSSSAEGFGLTIAEALACGTPAVALDYSSVPEVMGAEHLPVNLARQEIREAPGGLLVTPSGLLDNIYGYFWADANVQLLTQAVERMLGLSREERKMIGLRGASHVARTFTWPKAAEAFLPLLEPAEAAA